VGLAADAAAPLASAAPDDHGKRARRCCAHEAVPAEEGPTGTAFAAGKSPPSLFLQGGAGAPGLSGPPREGSRSSDVTVAHTVTRGSAAPDSPRRRLAPAWARNAVQKASHNKARRQDRNIQRRRHATGCELATVDSGPTFFERKAGELEGARTSSVKEVTSSGCAGAWHQQRVAMRRCTLCGARKIA